MTRAPLSGERGAILPIAGAALMMMLVVAALVIDVANWFEHGKTLQIRADAAALAAGQRWAYPCDSTTTNDAIEATAREYVGSHMRHPPSAGTLVTSPYNNLITTTKPNDVHVVFNSLAYFENGGSDWTDRADPNDALTGKPCGREYLDVKITEENIGGFFGRFAGRAFLPSLSRKARVAPFEVESLEGILPIGVKAFDVRSAAVLFVATGADGTSPPLAKKYLAKDPDGDGPDNDTPPAPDYPGFVRWTNETDPTPPCGSPPTPPCDSNDATPASFTMPNGSVEAVLVLSSRSPCGAQGVAPPCLDLLGPTATVNQICNQGDTSCFDRTVSGSPPVQALRGGISRVAGYNPAADSTVISGTNTTPPAVRSVYLEPLTGPTGCRTGPYSFGDAPCDVRLVADIRVANRTTAQQRYEAFDGLGWCPNNGCALSHVSGTTWAAILPAEALAETAIDGRNPIRLRWRVATGSVSGQACANGVNSGNNACDGGFNADGMGYIGTYTTGFPVHQAFSANEFLVGPAELIRVWDSTTTPATVKNTFPRTANVTLFVDVFLSNVVATAPGDPPIALRITGSQNGSIDCDPNIPQFSDEFAKGCNPRYTTNTFTSNPPCPDYNVLWNTPQPWSCVKTQTGVALGEISKGLKDRVLEGGNVCVPDNDGNLQNFRAGWNWWNRGLGPPGTYGGNPGGTMFPNFDPRDPRLVTLFITPFGSFQGSGNAIFPISGFGAFYITGWSITGGTQDPCPGADPAPDKFLIGHFIKDVLISGATPSTNKCNPASLTPCVVSLVE